MKLKLVSKIITVLVFRKEELALVFASSESDAFQHLKMRILQNAIFQIVTARLRFLFSCEAQSKNNENGNKKRLLDLKNRIKA